MWFLHPILILKGFESLPMSLERALDGKTYPYKQHQAWVLEGPLGELVKLSSCLGTKSEGRATLP